MLKSVNNAWCDLGGKVRIVKLPRATCKLFPAGIFSEKLSARKVESEFALLNFWRMDKKCMYHFCPHGVCGVIGQDRRF